MQNCHQKLSKLSRKMQVSYHNIFTSFSTFWRSQIHLKKMTLKSVKRTQNFTKKISQNYASWSLLTCIDAKLSSEMIKIGKKVLLIVDRGWLVATQIVLTSFLTLKIILKSVKETQNFQKLFLMICIDMYRCKIVNLSSKLIKIGEKVLLIVDRGWLVATQIGAIGSSVA